MFSRVKQGLDRVDTRQNVLTENVSGLVKRLILCNIV